MSVLAGPQVELFPASDVLVSSVGAFGERCDIVFSAMLRDLSASASILPPLLAHRCSPVGAFSPEVHMEERESFSKRSNQRCPGGHCVTDQ